MAVTKCKSICSPVLGRKCKARRKRACECGKYAAVSLSLEDACLKQYANSGTFKSLEAWEKANAELILVKTGVPVAGYDPTDSFTYQLGAEQDEQNQRRETQKRLFFGLIALVILGGIAYLITSLNK